MRAKKGHEAHAAAEDGTEREQTTRKAERERRNGFSGETGRRLMRGKPHSNAESKRRAAPFEGRDQAVFVCKEDWRRETRIKTVNDARGDRRQKACKAGGNLSSTRWEKGSKSGGENRDRDFEKTGRCAAKRGKTWLLEPETEKRKSTGSPCFLYKRKRPKRGGEEKAYSKFILVLSPMVTEVVFSFPSRT